jgi:hypothetical protein
MSAISKVRFEGMLERLDYERDRERQAYNSGWMGLRSLPMTLVLGYC